MNDFNFLDPLGVDGSNIIIVSLLAVNPDENPLVVFDTDTRCQLVTLHTRQQVHDVKHIGHPLTVVLGDLEHISLGIVFNQALSEHQFGKRYLHDGILPILSKGSEV